MATSALFRRLISRNSLKPRMNWIALTQASMTSGCMCFVPGSHEQKIVKHCDSYASDNPVSWGQEISVTVDESGAVHAVLQPGEMSLHHGRLFHASGPNNSSHRRTSLAIRYAISETTNRKAGFCDARPGTRS